MMMSNVDTTTGYFYCAAMPDAPRLRFAAAIGIAQAVALAAYGLSILVFEWNGTTTGVSGAGADLAPALLVALYVAFAALAAVPAFFLSRGKPSARTPFVFVQVFALVIAQTLLAASQTRLVGVIVALSAAAGIASVTVRGNSGGTV